MSERDSAPVDLGEIKRLLSEARLPDALTFLDLGEVVGPDDRVVAIVPAQESFDARGELIAAALTNLPALIAELEQCRSGALHGGSESCVQVNKLLWAETERADLAAAELEAARKGVTAAQQMHAWLSGLISQASYYHEDGGHADAPKTLLTTLDTAMRDGTMASYRDQFEAALGAKP